MTCDVCGKTLKEGESFARVTIKNGTREVGLTAGLETMDGELEGYYHVRCYRDQREPVDQYPDLPI
jgi:hypothetical protein